VENRKLEEMPKKIPIKTITLIKMDTKDYKIYTPNISLKYMNSFREVLKITNNKTQTKFIMYNRVLRWYQNEENVNLSMEKIYIKTKLGSYTSGGCGIGASVFAGLTASGIFSYVDNYLKKLSPLLLVMYVILVLYFGFKILSNEDNKVEMYNMFLEVLNNLQEYKTDKLG